jgi:hypothetical protein
MTLTLSKGDLVFDMGEYRSRLLPTVDAVGAAIDYVPVDPPEASILPNLMLALRQDDVGEPPMVLTVEANPGEDALVTPSAVTGP